jgi:hypothetical protein
MSITKRDIADISLVGIALHYVPYLFSYAMHAISAICEFLRPEAEVVPSYQGFTYTTVFPRGPSVFLCVGEFCVMAAFFWFLLFKRHIVLNRLFPGSDEKSLELPDHSVTQLTDYSFWVTLFGLFTGIHSGIKLVPGLLRWVNTSQGIGVYFQTIWKYHGTDILSVIVAVLVIWKANRIADMLRSTKHTIAT